MLHLEYRVPLHPKLFLLSFYGFNEQANGGQIKGCNWNCRHGCQAFTKEAFIIVLVLTPRDVWHLFTSGRVIVLFSKAFIHTIRG